MNTITVCPKCGGLRGETFAGTPCSCTVSDSDRSSEPHSNAALKSEVERLKVELKEAQAAAAVMRGELERSNDLLGEIRAYGNCECEPPDIICIPCQCSNKRDGNSKAMSSSSGKAWLERMKEALSSIEKIRAISTGENQVADTDTEAMGVIQKECDAFLKGEGVKA